MATAVNPSRYYKAHGAALALWTDRSPEIVLSGPAGTGKSKGCLEKLNAAALRWPGMRGLIVRKTRESITESALVTFEEKVLPVDSPICAGAKRSVRKSYRYPNGSEIIVGGLLQSGKDQKQKIMSTEYDMIYVQEAIELSENDWENLTTRLRNGVMPFQQVIADTNPDGPMHWLKRRADAGKTVMLESRHEDNPTIWDASTGTWTESGEAYIGKLDGLTGIRYYRLRKGMWVAAEGVVYTDWDRSQNLVDPKDIPATSRLIRSIDFGYTNPFVCQWWAIDNDGRMYLYREIYRTQRTVADHAKEIKELSGNERYEVTVADHDAEDRATLHQNGIVTQAAHKSISPGIQAVEGRLRAAGDGRPRLFASRSALVARDESLVEAKKPTGTVEEFDGYAWPKGQDGRSIKEVPVDADNHGMDAMRYAVAYVDHLAGKSSGPAFVGAPRQLPISQLGPQPVRRPGQPPPQRAPGGTPNPYRR